MKSTEIRNPYDNDRLICTVSELSPAVEILVKGWLTRIEFTDSGAVVTHIKAK